MTEFVDISLGNSLFSVIDKYCYQQFGGRRQIHRLFTLARKHEAQTLIVSEVYAKNFPKLNDEITALNNYFGDKIDFQAFQFVVIDKQVNNFQQLRNINPNENILSDTVIINYKYKDYGWLSYLFYAIHTFPHMYNKNGEKTCIINNYYCLHNVFFSSIRIDDTLFRFTICGTIFHQQNVLTSVCAHAAICSILNTLNTEDYIFPEDINNFLGVDHINYKYTYLEGIHGDSFSRVSINDNITSIIFNSYGYKVIKDDYSNCVSSDKYSHYLYSNVESRLPSLLIFSTKQDDELHVVPLIGHTLNTDLWMPEAELAYSDRLGNIHYRNTSAWVDHFIIHDDNFGMYSCLPVDSLWKEKKFSQDPSFRAVCSLSILPNNENIQSTSIQAQWVALSVLEAFLEELYKSYDTNYWIQLLYLSLRDYKKSPIVTRNLFINYQEFALSLEDKDYENNYFSNHDKNNLLSDLPENFWLIEITLPDLYTANRSKIADVIYPPDVDINEYGNIDNILYTWNKVRFPELILKNKLSQDIDTYNSSVSSHYPLLRHSCYPFRAWEW